MAKKILIIDDSALMRRVISDIIKSGNDYEVAAVAKDGLEGLDMIVSNPGLYSAVILDINMPKMNGLELLEKLQKMHIEQKVIVVSTVAKQGARETIRALELGAFDFVTKPENYLETKGENFKKRIYEILDVATSSSKTDRLSASAVPKPSMYDTISGGRHSESVTGTQMKSNFGMYVSGDEVAKSRDTEGLKSSALTGSLQGSTTGSHERNTGALKAGSTAASQLGKTAVGQTDDGLFDSSRYLGIKRGKSKIVALACSTGGPKSLQQVIPMLPGKLDAPVVLVQHMPAGFTLSLAQRLDEMSSIHVKEAEDGDVLKNGTVYIAPGGRHMRVVRSGRECCIRLSDEPAVEGLRPCANLMYESLENCGYDEVTCVVLTGMGADGTNGIKGLAARHVNIHVIAQDEDTCIVYGMPKAIAQSGLVDEVVPLSRVAEEITRNVGVS